MSIRTAFQEQSEHCAALGSPFMGRLMRLMAERLEPGTPVTDRIFGWSGDPSPSADNVPLRLAGALHALRLSGRAFEDVYPPADVDDDTLWAAILDSFHDHERDIIDWLERAPQTNEVRRASVVIAALALLRKTTDLPVELLELGTSGGLNLRADTFRLELPGFTLGPEDAEVVLTPDWTGPPPPTELPKVIRRAGVDLSPIDPLTDEGRLRLLAYIWADQPDRIDRTEAAIRHARRTPADLHACDAAAWLEDELARPSPDRLRVVFHTVAWQYFPDTVRARILDAIAKTSGPIARLGMEFDGGRGAGLTLTLPDGHMRAIGRADFHGRWIDWSPAEPV